MTDARAKPISADDLIRATIKNIEGRRSDDPEYRKGVKVAYGWGAKTEYRPKGEEGSLWLEALSPLWRWDEYDYRISSATLGLLGISFSEEGPIQAPIITEMNGLGISTTETAADRGARYNSGKPRLFFNSLGLEVQKGEAAVWEAGAKKYAPGNWLKGMSWTEGADSLRRHLDAFLAGEDLDPETGLPHVDHLICCAKILSNSFHTRPDLDDRPPEVKS